MIKVLFVCTGNICRSPMAEAVLRDMVNKAGLSEQIKVASAGIGPWHVGDPAHPGTLAVLKRNNIAHNGRGRQIERDDLDTFDYVLAMDTEHLSFIRRYSRGTSADVRLFLSFAQQAGTVTESEVPDPYYSGKFDHVFSLVQRGCIAFLEHVRKAHGL